MSAMTCVTRVIAVGGRPVRLAAGLVLAFHYVAIEDALVVLCSHRPHRAPRSDLGR